MTFRKLTIATVQRRIRVVHFVLVVVVEQFMCQRCIGVVLALVQAVVLTAHSINPIIFLYLFQTA